MVADAISAPTTQPRPFRACHPARLAKPEAMNERRESGIDRVLVILPNSRKVPSGAEEVKLRERGGRHERLDGILSCNAVGSCELITGGLQFVFNGEANT